MKNIVISALLAVLLFGIQSVPADRAEAAPKNHVAQTYYAPNMAIAYDTFIDSINRRLPDLNISKFYGSQIVSSANLLDGIKSGLIYIGHIVPHMYGEIECGNIITTMPFITQNAAEANDLFFKERYFRFIESEMSKYGLKVLGITWGSPYHLLTKKKINSLQELSGLKIRAIGAAAKILAKFGAVCLNTPPEELYLALQDGTLDGVILGSAYEYKQAGLHETARWYNTTAIADPIVDYFVMSQKAWEQLSEKEQKIILEEAQKVQNLWYDDVMKTEQQLRQTIFKDTTYAFDKDDEKKLQYASQAYLNEELAQNPKFENGVGILIKFAEKKNPPIK